MEASVKNENRKLLITSIIYAVGQIAGQLINFSMISLYTVNLGKTGYGKLATLLTYTGFLNAFLILSIYSGFCRFYKDTSDKNKLFNSTLTFSYILGLAATIFMLFFYGRSSHLLYSYGAPGWILWIIVYTAFFSEINAIYMSKFSMEYRALKVTGLTVARLLVQFLLSIYFLVVLKKGIVGALSSQMISVLLIFLYLTVTERKQFKFEMSPGMLRKMLIFSCGLLPVNIAGWILTLSDRYFINYFHGFAETGIYNLGYQFGMLINPLFVTPFLSTFTTYKFDIYREKTAREKFKALFRKYNLIGCFLILSIAIYARIAIKLVSSQDFESAYIIVPFVLYSYFQYGKTGYLGLGLQLKNKTYKIGIFMMVCALANVVLNFFLIPELGIIGAALTTFISYYLLNIILTAISQKEYKIDLDLKYNYTTEGITISLYIAYYLISKMHPAFTVEVLSNALLLLMYVLLVLAFKLTDPGYLRGQLKKVKMKSFFSTGA